MLVVTHADGAADPVDLEAALLAHCRRELPNFMVPGAIVIRDTMPHNQNGKIDRRALTEQYQDIFRT